MATPTYRVVVLDGQYAEYDQEHAVLDPIGAELILADCDNDPDRMADAVTHADGVFVRISDCPRSVVEAMANCRVIVRYGVGYDNVDVQAASERGIKVANVPDYGVEEVSDHAVALLLAVNRQIAVRDSALRNGIWDQGTMAPVHRIRGSVLGVVGFGRIARAFVRKMAGFDLSRVLVFDPFVQDWPGDVEPAELETIWRQADYISLHSPLTETTRHMVDRESLSLMKPGAVLINSSRGGLIDDDALAEALSSGRLRGAGLDVFESEPPSPDHPLMGLSNVVLSDHFAWYSVESLADLKRKAAEEVRRVLEGGDPVNWVNRAAFG